jgi:hypothetical protein
VHQNCNFFLDLSQNVGVLFLKFCRFHNMNGVLKDTSEALISEISD